ncbi:MAG: 4Fe-4S cluster-binding domain-containing protein [Candidatus Methanomethylicaceae archaeon]
MRLPFAIKRGVTNILETESRGRGLVARFWGCNLKCPLCFAQSYAYRNEMKGRQAYYVSLDETQRLIEEKFKEVNLFKLKWLRIEGGEPLASNIHVEFIERILKTLAKMIADTTYFPSLTVVIQTNGIWLGASFSNTKLFYEKIYSSLIFAKKINKLKIAIEISFKGANEGACEIYSGVKGVLKLQYNAFKNSLEILKDYWKDGKAIAIHLVAGFGPSFKELAVIPLDPKELEKGSEIPLFHPDSWSSEFNEIMKLYENVIETNKEVYTNYIQSHGKRIHMYGLEFCGRNWQGSWINPSMRDVTMRNFVRKYLRLNNEENVLRKTGFYRKLLQEMKLNNVLEFTLEKVKDMHEYFVELETPNHYPNL